MKSSYALLIIVMTWVFSGAFYYPKWAMPLSEATISWDVSGYYHYLPAVFIYKDIRRQDWMSDINARYLPSPAYDQAIGHHDSGNKVNKYMIGQAILYTPFFLVSHVYASLSDAYPADGYSRPYQFGIWLGSLLFAILGLVLLRKIVREYFSDEVTFFSLIALALGTHWLEYASITNAMNHSWLFTLLCVLIVSTIRFYKKTDWVSVLGIGCSLGLAVLTRPTELIWAIVPLTWGMVSPDHRFRFLTKQYRKVLVAIAIVGIIVFIQLAYWKYATGEWIVYTYGDQGFNWLHPAIRRGLTGVNIGWWTYTPLMFLAMFGWYALYKKHRSVFFTCLITSFLAVYITLSWSHFEQGGGLGQRNLIQVYPLLAFPLAALFGKLLDVKFGRWLVLLMLAANIYYTGWWVHQAHKGGYFQAGQMTSQYFKKVVCRLDLDKDYFKLLDNDEYFEGTPKEMTLLLQNDFENDTSLNTLDWPGRTNATYLDGGSQFFGPIDIPIVMSCDQWLRYEADFMIQSREWTYWKYAQWIVQFFRGDQVVKTNVIRPQRMIPEDHVRTHLFFDVKVPYQSFDRCTMTLWNAESEGQLLIDDLKVSCFRE